MDVTTAVRKFLRQLEADGRSPHTVGQYRRHLRLFAAWAADVGHSGRLSAIDHETVARFLTSRQARTSAQGGKKRATSMNCLRTSLKLFFRFAHRAGLAADDPGRLIRHAVCGPPPPRTLSDDERRKLLETLAAAEGPEAERDHALVAVMLATGIRLSSAIALDVGDVDLGRGELQLRKTKGDRPATVYLGKAIRKHLGSYLAGRTSGPLFPARHGGRLCVRHVQRRFREWVAKAGIERSFSPHALRHTMAQTLYNRTGDLFLVKAALHHRSIVSTMVYAQPDERRLRAALG